MRAVALYNCDGLYSDAVFSNAALSLSLSLSLSENYKHSLLNGAALKQIYTQIKRRGTRGRQCVDNVGSIRYDHFHTDKHTYLHTVVHPVLIGIDYITSNPVLYYSQTSAY